MSEVVERAAKAMYELDPIMEQATDLDNRQTGKPFAIGWEKLAEIDGGYHEHYKERARAAIGAIRELPDAVMERAWSALDWGENAGYDENHASPQSAWRLMIDEMLK